MAPSPKSSVASVFSPLPGDGRGDDEVELGFISGIFGVRGEVRVHLHNRESDFLSRSRKVVFLAPDGNRYAGSLKCRAGAGKRMLGAIPQVLTREHASELRDWKLLISSKSLPQLEEGEFYVWRVIGLPAMVGDTEVGRVVDVHSSGPVDIFEIQTADGLSFVPALKGVLTVDVAAGRVELAEDALVEE